MAVVEKSALVRHSAHQMYQLVCDVEQYQDFLPWCKSSRLLSQDPERICGEIEVARIGISQTFQTCNRLIPDERMDIELVKGPFTRLDGAWKFTALREDACKIELELHFEFSGALINKAFGLFFTQAANSMVDAFCKRADELYID
ncbi:MAG: type II toxin-antitoxin system RatA family toxin [gamma proteobacterium symbiont of Bathyaustriella thionipta]|nr:type II toxin-antitoxin system RatA family toxin [gamma proteobacterium symbiont of Bathyaustriella thionipta]